ncbi:hypothetical protein GIV76_16595, partial [Pseudomonas syringae]|nr:hypothetical protein [Pseudomonas syringae]
MHHAVFRCRVDGQAVEDSVMLISVQALRAFAAWVVVCHHFMQIFFD